MSSLPELEYPKAAWVDNVFSSDNWGDPVCTWLRDAVASRDWAVRGRKTYPVSVDVSGDGHLEAAAVYTSRLKGVYGFADFVFVPYAARTQLYLVRLELLDRWILVAWQAGSQKTDFVGYVRENKGTFVPEGPCSYEDAVVVGHFLHAPLQCKPTLLIDVRAIGSWLNPGVATRDGGKEGLSAKSAPELKSKRIAASPSE